MPDFLVFSALPAAKTGKKIILNLHDMFPELLYDLHPNKILFKLALFIERKSIQFSNYCIVVHQEHFNLIKNRSIKNKNSEIILNTFNPDLYKPDIQKKKKSTSKTLIYSGSSSPRFGLDILIQSVKQLINQNYDIRLKILSGGKSIKHLLKIIEKLNLSDYIEISGDFTNYQNSLQNISLSDIGIVSYRNTTFTNYVLPVKMFEYSYLGLPVITPRLRTICNYFPEDSVFYYTPEDITDLTKQLIKCLDNPGLAQQKSHTAKTIIDNYSWSLDRKKYLKIISKLTE
ncbi:MAG: hypothetical protein APR63_13745 [Desulfuromonas sp. SDB]|nr:MAG: hypothetical protein APR63_13745 [Desulfuromonas sp. SDB]